MKKLLLKFTVILLLIGVLGYGIARFYAPIRFKTRMEIISSPKIPQSHNNLSIAVVADLKGDLNALEKISKSIQNAQAEVVLFMGDTFGTDLDNEQMEAFKELIASIQPKYSKLALLDTESQRQGYKHLGFMMVTTNQLKIHTNTEDYILLQTRNTDETQTIESDLYTVLITNQNKLKAADGYDLIIHPLSSQDYVKIPYLLNSFNKKERMGNNTVLSHMGSSTQYDYRFFSNPELLIITLKSQ